MGDARVVLLYVDDEEESVSVQDIYNWLTILGAVEEVKPQYDPSTKGICFSVTFKLPVTAQQCVYYLNGAKLKNCLVTMKSSVYSAPSDDASSVKKEEEVQISANLPNNHLMPSELRMDTLLAERLHRLSEGDFEGSAEMIEKLKKLQQQFVAANQKCEALASVPEEPVQKRKKEESSVYGGVFFNTFCGISLTLCQPETLCQRVTEAFGPLSVAQTIYFPVGHFTLYISFLFWADADRFIKAVAEAKETGRTDSSTLLHAWATCAPPVAPGRPPATPSDEPLRKSIALLK